MKSLALIAIIAGILLITIVPRFQNEVSGEVLDSGTVYFRSQGDFKPVTVSLDPENNPLKIRLYGYFLPGGAYLDDAVSLDVQVDGDTGKIFSETITLSQSDTKRTPREKDREEGSILLSQTTNPFAVAEAGTYILSVRSQAEIDFSLSLLDAVVIEKVAPPLPNLTIPGVALVLFGVILLHRARRISKKRRRKNKRKKSVDTSKPTLENLGDEKTEPVTPPPRKKPNFRWGRQKKQE